MSWCTIESDPGVFTEMINEIGVSKVQVDEIFQIDKETMMEMDPVYGLIFLFKWRKDLYKTDRAEIAEGVPGLFFAKQVVTNACATQAIMSVLLNSKEIELGNTLSAFKEFTMDLDPETRGIAIGNSEPVRKVHNSFARAEPILSESKTATEDDDVYHFIAYLPHDGKVYELDGMRSGPILLGEYDSSKKSSWTDIVQPEITKRFQEDSNIMFNLLAITKDRETVLNSELAKLAALKTRIEAKLMGSSAMEDDTTDALPEGEEALRNKLSEIEDDEEVAKAKMISEQQKKAQWAKENVRRRTNFVPFVYQLLRRLAKTGKLKALREAGAKEQRERATNSNNKSKNDGDESSAKKAKV